MKKILWIALGIITVSSCNELEVTGEEYPDHNSVTTANVQTDLDIINIEVDIEQYRHMYNNFEDRVLVQAKVDYITNDGDTILWKRPAQIEIKGATSARKSLKSLGIIFNEAVNNDSTRFFIPEKIVANHDLSELKTIRLRNSGNDFNGTMLKDMMYTQIAIDAGLDLEIMYLRPLMYFVNDQFQGILNMRTESNAHGISHFFGADSSDITILKIDNDNGNLEYDEGDVSRARELIDAIRSDDYKTITELVDLNNFIEYIIFQDYIGNSDWPHNNSRAFSVNGSLFRFIVYDLDFASFNTKNKIIPDLEYKKDDVSKIFQAFQKELGTDELYDLIEQRQRVVYKDIDVNRFFSNVDYYAHLIEEEMRLQIDKYRQPPSMFHWRMELEQLKREMKMRDKHNRRNYDLD